MNEADYKEQLGAPDAAELREEFLYALDRRDAGVFRRQRLNYNARYCIWKHQSPDGRKWSSDKGKDVFPFPGASDSRPHMIDRYINEDVAKLMVVARRNRIAVQGMEINDEGWATRATQVLRWMKYTQMKERERETRLLANYFLERGAGVMGMFWCRERQLGYEHIDLEQFRVLAMEIAQGNGMLEGGDAEAGELVELPGWISDPSRELRAAKTLQTMYPEATLSALRAAVKEMRETGSASFPQPYIVKDRPCYVALAPNEDVFISPEATEPNTAAGIWRVEAVTETQLMERQSTRGRNAYGGKGGYNRAWVQEVLRSQRGRFSSDFDMRVLRRNGNLNWQGRGTLNAERLFEVVHAFRRRHDANGVPGLYYTCFSTGIADSVASDALMDYDHGEQPFTLFQREVRSRQLDDSRGYGEIASTWQNQKKTEWDSRIDRSSLAQLPPFYHPAGEAPESWGPGVKIATMRPSDYGWLDVPKYDGGSKEIELSVEAHADQYFGRVVPDKNNVTEAGIIQQDLADNWMAGWLRVDTQMFQLMQQYMPDQFFYRIVGSSKSKPLKAERTEIQGQFDLSVTFNVDDLDPEKKAEKMKLLREVLSLDTGQVTDRNEIMSIVFELFDPNMGERVLRPAAEAAQAEAKDEKVNFALMLAGVDSDVLPDNAMNYELRMQTLAGIFQNNPMAMQQYERNETFRTLVDKRMKQLQFQYDQHMVNPGIGLKGA